MKTQADIDTSAPFTSVKEAVVLFGERVLASELYAANKLRQQQVHDENSPNMASIAAELQETKQSLVRAREDSMLMANVLTSLQEDLDHTKRELRQLKEIKVDDDHVMKTETIQKEKYVTFSDTPTVFHVVPQSVVLLQRHPSLKKTKRKPLIPFIKGIFRKKGGEVSSSA